MSGCEICGGPADYCENCYNEMTCDFNRASEANQKKRAALEEAHAEVRRMNKIIKAVYNWRKLQRLADQIYPGLDKILDGKL